MRDAARARYNLVRRLFEHPDHKFSCALSHSHLGALSPACLRAKPNRKFWLFLVSLKECFGFRHDRRTFWIVLILQTRISLFNLLFPSFLNLLFTPFLIYFFCLSVFACFIL